MKPFYYLLLLCLISCHGYNKQKQDKDTLVSDWSKYEGNAFLLMYPYYFDGRIYVIPVNESDSNKFKTMSIDEVNVNSPVFKVYVGTAIKFKNKISLHTKIMPYDTMYLLRAYINYKNYKVIQSLKDKNYFMLVADFDSDFQFKTHIYH